MQGDSFGSTRSLTVPPTVPPAKNSSLQAQCAPADMRLPAGRLRIEELGLHGHIAFAQGVERDDQDHDDLGDETPVAAAQGVPWSQWWVR